MAIPHFIGCAAHVTWKLSLSRLKGLNGQEQKGEIRGIMIFPALLQNLLARLDLVKGENRAAPVRWYVRHLVQLSVTSSQRERQRKFGYYSRPATISAWPRTVRHRVEDRWGHSGAFLDLERRACQGRIYSVLNTPS